jgi:diacylglycerol kinase family enzyme
MDLASANGRLFINMASLGYGGEVVEKTHSREAFWSKTSMVYQVEGALGLLGVQGCRCELKADGEVAYRGEFFGAFVGNGKANGSGLFWTPTAEIDDGKLDAVVFGKPGLLSMATALSAVKKRKPPSFKHTVARATELVFHFDRPTALELDGEFVGRSLTHEFKCLPQALQVWLPV